ncbi:MAG: hypothetical protein IT315_03435 [Anaerolineales bacterium]|nr:hypothetical protein [Anaerolineales bacterium]
MAKTKTTKTKAKPSTTRLAARKPAKPRASAPKGKAGMAAPKAKPKSIVLSPPSKSAARSRPAATTKVRVPNKAYTSRIASSGERKMMLKSLRLPQYNYMKPPGVQHDFQVGDKVEVFCDHEKNRDRIRGWIQGVVVQVDNKLVAVQFRSNVYLTDGWMVPDRILWYPLTSEHMRPVPGKKSAKREEKVIPDY